MTPLVPQMLVRPGCLRTSYAVKGAAHQPDVSRRSGACQFCSSALLGEELCFRHTTILGSCRDLTVLAASLPRRPYNLSGLADGCAALFGPFGCPKEAWASARIDKRPPSPPKSASNRRNPRVCRASRSTVVLQRFEDGHQHKRL